MTDCATYGCGRVGIILSNQINARNDAYSDIGGDDNNGCNFACDEAMPELGGANSLRSSDYLENKPTGGSQITYNEFIMGCRW